MLALTLFFPKPTNSGTEEDQNNFRPILLRVSLFQLPASRDPLAGQCPNPAPHHKLDSSTMFHHHVVCVRVHTAGLSAQGQPSEDGGEFLGNPRYKSQSRPSRRGNTASVTFTTPPDGTPPIGESPLLVN